MELKEKCDVATGAGSAMGGLDPALLVPAELRPGAAAAPAHAPYPVARPVEVTAEAARPPISVPGEVCRYEDLDGAEGRGVLFRPHRYATADLAPLRPHVSVTVSGVTRELELVDVSQSGIGVIWPEGIAIQARQRVALTLRFDTYVAFRGDARVGSVRLQGTGTLVGLSFLDFLLDVDEVLQLRDVQGRRAGGHGSRLADQDWHLDGHEHYKSLVSELRLFFEDARRELTSVEASLPWSVLNGPPNPARAALVNRLRVEFVTDVVAQTEAIDAAIRRVPGGLKNAAARAWAMRHLDEALLQAPSCQRALNKPFGYAGDYELMNFIYERHFEGPTLFARAISLAFLSTRAPMAVRCRKDLVKRQLQDLLAQRAGSREPVRVLSIAAGPAQELYEVFEELDELPVPVEVVLFEQDRNALTHAWRRLRTSAEARFPHGVRLTYLHDSVKRLLRDEKLFADYGRFDLVFSCGLLDYFQRNTAVSLVRRMAATTKPGGQLLVANMVDHPIRWVMEWHLDWNLIYRTHQELLEIGQRADPTAQVRILEEASGANPFFQLVPS